MATLEDLLSRLPDNDTGEIDAADLRYIVTELWDQAAALATTGNARLDALEAASGTSTVAGVWRMNFTADAEPGAHQVTCDTGQFGTATWMRFSDTSDGGADFSHILAGATQIRGQERDNAANHGVWAVTGPAVVGAGWHEVPVAFESGIAGALNGRVDAVFVFTVPVGQ